MAGKRIASARRKPVPRSKPPFALEGIDHILLLADGMAPAARFCTKVLGRTIEDRLPQFGMLQLRAGAAWARPPVGTSMRWGRTMKRSCATWRHGVEIIEERVYSGTRRESLSLYGNAIEVKGPPA